MNKKPPSKNFRKGPPKARRSPPVRPGGRPAASPEPEARTSGRGKQAPPESTLRETQYLKDLVTNKTPVCVKLHDNEAVEGVIEYYDANMIRLTREGEANLFIYKSEIKYLEEQT